MNIMFDIDGVLADFILGFTNLANKMFGTPITSTYMQPKWDGFPDITVSQIEATWDRVNESRDFWYSLIRLEGMDIMERISALRYDGHRVYFVTARPSPSAHRQTIAWLNDNWIKDPEVIAAPSSRKGELASALSIDYAIDDKAGNAVYVQYHVPSIKSYLIDRPYNQFDHDVLGSKVRRVKNVVEYLNDIEAAK